MKWIKFKTSKGNTLTVKEDDITLILIDPSTGEGTLRLNNSCFTYDIIDNGIIYYFDKMSAARPLPDYDPEILRKEIQDLKLENDRLKRRNELMEDYIHALACIKSKKSKFHGLCDNISCPYYDQDKAFGEGACTLGSRALIEQEAADIIEELEEL